MPDIDIRTKILEEALRLFAHNGYGSTSVREIAERSGVTKPTLYYHFGNKEGLFRAIVQTRLDQLGALVDAAVRGDGSPLARLRTFFEAYVGGALLDLDTLRFFMTCGLPSSGERPPLDVIGRHLQSLGAITEVVRQGIAAGELREDLDPRLATIGLVGAVNLHLVAAVNGAELGAATVEDLLDLWLRGVSR